MTTIPVHPAFSPHRHWLRPIVGAAIAIAVGLLGGCSTADDGDNNTKNIGSVTFDVRTSADLSAHPLGMPTTGTWSFIDSDTPPADVDTAPEVRRLSWQGPGNVLDVPTVKQDEPTAIGTFTGFYARSVNGAIYLVRVDLDGNTYLGVGQPTLFMPASMAVDTIWTVDFGANIARITSVDATSPSGYTGCILIRITDGTDGTHRRDDYWRIGDGLLERVINPGLPAEQRQRRRDVPVPPVEPG